MKVVHPTKPQFDTYLALIGELIIDPIGKTRFHPGQDLIEIVAINLHELTISDPGQRLIRHSGKITKHAQHKWQFFILYRASDLHVISDMHPWRANAIEFMLSTFFLRHLRLLLSKALKMSKRAAVKPYFKAKTYRLLKYGWQCASE